MKQDNFLLELDSVPVVFNLDKYDTCTLRNIRTYLVGTGNTNQAITVQEEINRRLYG